MGSSDGSSLNTSFDLPPTFPKIFSASERMVNSPGLPSLTGPMKPWGGGFHEPDKAFDHVVYVAEGAGLHSGAVNGDVITIQGLYDEVGDHAPVVGVHARSVCVENAGHANIQAVLAVIVE